MEDTPPPPGFYPAGQRPEDQRGAKRLTLLLRSAKLVCTAGEFVCIVHDVSATGVRLRVFHPLPDQGELALVQGNGAVHFLDRVWQKGEFAGFRFAVPVDVAEFVSEPSPWPRRPVRINLERPALILAQGGVNTAAVLNLSAQGAAIVTERYLAVGQRVRLEAQGMPSRMGCVKWRALPRYGLVFDQTMSLPDFACMVGQLQLNPLPPPAAAPTPDWRGTVLPFRQ